jgi:type IV pilus assembly protein PilE
MIARSARPDARLRGFTSTEILIALVIVGLLAAFGVPSALKYGLRGRLASGQILLKRIAQEEAAWYQAHHGYATLAQLGYPVSTGLAAIYLDKDGSISASTSEDSTYRVSVTLNSGNVRTGEAPYFLATARPVNRQQQETDCGTLSLASTGQVGASGDSGEADCWSK